MKQYKKIVDEAGNHSIIKSDKTISVFIFLGVSIFHKANLFFQSNQSLKLGIFLEIINSLMQNFR
jgi:hypothetical protein